MTDGSRRLNSGLKPTNQTQNAQIGSPETESFLKQLEDVLIKEVTEDIFKKNKKDEKLKLFMVKLQQSNIIVVATDKSN